MKSAHPLVYIIGGVALALIVIIIWERLKPQPVTQQISCVIQSPAQLSENTSSPGIGWWLAKLITLAIGLTKLVTMVWHLIF